MKSERCGNVLVQIYGCHFILKLNQYQALVGHKKLDKAKKQQVVDEINYVFEALHNLLEEMQVTHKTMNFVYPNIVIIVLKYIFPKINILPFLQFYLDINLTHFTNTLTKLFQLYDDQLIAKYTTVDSGKVETDMNRKGLDIEVIKKDIIAFVYCFLQLDYNGDYGLAPIFIKSVLTRSQRLNEDYAKKPDFMRYIQLLLEFIEFLNIYSKRSKNNNKGIVKNFANNLHNLCEKYKFFLHNVSVNTLTEMWFSNSLVLYLYIISNLLNTELFNDFWQQMQEPQSFETIILLTIVVIKLCSNIRRDVNLYIANCCMSIKKHVIISLTQNILAIFVIYCRTENIKTIELEVMEVQQNPNNHDALKKEIVSNGKSKNITKALVNYYNTINSIKSNIGVIVKYALNIFNQMECTNANAPDTKIFINRFKRIAATAQTKLQLDVYEMLLECLLIYKQQISSDDWIGLMKYYYLSIKQNFSEDIRINRELFICYTVTILNDSKLLDYKQVRTYIGNYYEVINKVDKGNNNNENNIVKDKNINNNIVNINSKSNGIDNDIIILETNDENDKNINNVFNNKDNNKNEIKSSNDELDSVCLYALYKKLQHPLKMSLNAQRSHLFFWCDMQYLMKYHRNNLKLMQSLFTVCSVEYYRVILTRFQRKEKSVLNWLEKYYCSFTKEKQLFENFDESTNDFKSSILNIIDNNKINNKDKDRIKKEKDNCLSSLEALGYGHCCVLLLQQEQDQYKGKFNAFSQIFEQHLDQLIQTDEFLNNIIINNANNKSMYYTIVIYRAFKYFFEMVSISLVLYLLLYFYFILFLFWFRSDCSQLTVMKP